MRPSVVAFVYEPLNVTLNEGVIRATVSNSIPRLSILPLFSMK